MLRVRPHRHSFTPAVISDCRRLDNLCRPTGTQQFQRLLRVLGDDALDARWKAGSHELLDLSGQVVGRERGLIGIRHGQASAPPADLPWGRGG